MTNYKLMPKEPTQEMLDRVMGIVIGLSGEYGQFNDYLNEETAREVYEAFRTDAPVVQGEPVAAQHRFRHPQITSQDWTDWHPAPLSLDRPSWEVDSQGYEVEYRLLYATAQPTERQSAICGYLINDGYKEQFVKTLSEGSRKIAQRFNWVVTAVCPCPDYKSEQGDEVSND